MGNRSVTRVIMVLLACLLTTGITAQTTTLCPPNLDFELGNLTQWQFFSGSCCPINAPVPGIIPGRHDLTNGPGIDKYGKFPIVAPGGGNYSLKLGNDHVAKEAERAVYYIQVPPAPGKYVFIYRYAVVLQNPSNHTPAQQPRFRVVAFDSITGTPLPCNEREYVSSSNLPGFILAPDTVDIYYKPWTTATLNLSTYSGQTVGIEFSSGDCDLNGHFGYGYVDMNCGLFQIYTTRCNNSTNAILKGPPGYQHYKWMDFNFSVTLGTTQDITIPIPTAPTYFAVIATPYQGFGCVDTFYTEYNVLNDNLVVTAADVKYCVGGQVQLIASTTNAFSPFLYNWWPSAGLSCTACNNPLAAPSVSTTYYVSIENKNGCIDTEDVFVTVNPKPVSNAGPDTTLCRGNKVTLQGSGGASYEWYPAAYLSNAKLPDPVATVNGFMIYNLIVKNIQGCRDTDQMTITPYPDPDANAGNDSSLCYGAVAQLHGTGGGTYKWFPSAELSDPDTATPRTTIKGTISFYLEVTNEHGCRDTDMVTFTSFNPDPFRAGKDTSICIGDTVHLFAFGGQVYTWLSDYNIGATTVPITNAWPSTNTIYTVHITDSVCNREDTLQVKVSMNPVKILKIVATPVVCGGDIGQLTVYGGKSYTWRPTDDLSDPHSNITKARPKTATLYTVTGINSYGCPDTASATLEVYGDDAMFVPDAFTPNGDGLNDCFRFIIAADITSFDLHIYNRWGEEVFHSANYSDCWDGTYKGEKLDLGTYYYFCKAKTPLCGDILKKGDIQLVR